jgi:hypothetical protein
VRFLSHLFVLLLLAFCLRGVPGQSAGPIQKGYAAKEIEAWQGELADGTPLTRKKLDEMLAAHREWLETADEKLDKEIAKAEAQGKDEIAWILNLLASDWEVDQGRLVLKGADLWKANLQGADLNFANLQGADLSKTNLQGAYLVYANLQGAYLTPKLQGAYLTYANLQGAYLSDANLQGAYLSETNLQGADLSETNLQGADLNFANLQGADLSKTNLQGAIYEPKPGALPNILRLRTARNLETLQFRDSPHALEELKQAFKQAGMRQQEQEITHAIKRSEQENAWKEGDFLESLLNRVFFDLPVAYGLYPGRALKILGSLIPVFALLYGWAIWRPSRNYAIYRIWPKERIEGTEDEARMAEDTKIERLNSKKSWRIITHALYFSLLSAFHIGWRELNVGNWITRLQIHPYTLQAEGWVRPISGLQSLISVYLLAMWVLTYFGRPFE